ncbi:MAG: head-tail connector protein [Paracoccus sp. (in: a-proteobacteria)]|uniref:head-tail connector protein n=1 Tax=Paracoccus sp. TaxID=267 RepID=UPI0026DFC82E|nr:head-tail connector protein [Paracoccus sp. (in: a-proteobacteria)]MDO5621922.1 head-tail connector protein [Paracoccus sp. (in: a-proteobacteria)]
MTLTLIRGPQEDFVHLDDLKAHLRVDHDDEDLYIAGLAAAAMAHIDGPRGILGRCIQPQVWRKELQGLDGPERLNLPGVTDVQVVDGADVRVTRLGGWTYVFGAGAVEFTASTPEDSWPALRMAVLLLVGHWYAEREASVEGSTVLALPLGVVRLLTPFRTGWVA